MKICKWHCTFYPFTKRAKSILFRVQFLESGGISWSTQVLLLTPTLFRLLNPAEWQSGSLPHRGPVLQWSANTTQTTLIPPPCSQSTASLAVLFSFFFFFFAGNWPQRKKAVKSLLHWKHYSQVCCKQVDSLSVSMLFLSFSSFPMPENVCYLSNQYFLMRRHFESCQCGTFSFISSIWKLNERHGCWNGEFLLPFFIFSKRVISGFELALVNVFKPYKNLVKCSNDIK